MFLFNISYARVSLLAAKQFRGDSAADADPADSVPLPLLVVLRVRSALLPPEHADVPRAEDDVQHEDTLLRQRQFSCRFPGTVIRYPHRN